MSPTAHDAPVWTPTPEQIAAAPMTAFQRAVARSGEPGASRVENYPSLWRWSVDEREAFWRTLARFCGVVAEGIGGRDPWGDAGFGLDRMAPPDPALGPRWFPDARLNFAENLLRFRDARTALVAWNERGRRRTLTYAELHAEVARFAAALRAAGVAEGDRVVGFIPNIPEAVIAMLAATSMGAVWSSCSPDFGAKGVLDRFGQIEPRVLLCADGYRYAGREIDCLARVREVAAAIPSIERIVVVPYLLEQPNVAGVRDAVTWDEFTNATPPTPLAFTRLPFDNPIYVMYSSGTTGLPKCMVHGAGGTLLQHLKEQVLHSGLTRDGRIFYFTTCGWMMWNWLVSALAAGAAVVLYDGAPLAPNPAILWDMAAAERLTIFGTSAKYLALAEKEGLAPARTHDLGALEAILSTGSPLAPSSYDYVRERVTPGVRLSSVSGGTDLLACFAIGNPVAPVWRGELQTRALGMAVEIWDDEGRPVQGAPGELVCTKPFPSMPVSFWNDPDGAKYRGAYFEHFPGVWRHGDWAELTAHDGVIIYGRSDATLNPGGVRIGTAEIYREVEQLDEIVESLVVGQDVGRPPDADTRIVLFVRLRPGVTLDDGLRERIRRRIRASASPHHVPKKIVQVADIPRTISGKITELAVREVIHGRPVKNVDALANPEALELYRGIPELRD